jgi:hypothetical protein
VKRIIPTVIAMACGLIVLLDFFLDVPTINTVGQTFVDWVVILAAFALIVGVLNLMRVHMQKVRRRAGGWGYSIVLILAMWIVLALGILDPAGPESEWVAWIFEHIQYPLQATIFALLAFFMVTAAYRAFRIRGWESIFFVAAGVIVLLGAIPFSQFFGSDLSEAREWIMAVPVVAGARGIILGVALATVVTGLRLLLGVDRPYAE